MGWGAWWDGETAEERRGDELSGDAGRLGALGRLFNRALNFWADLRGVAAGAVSFLRQFGSRGWSGGAIKDGGDGAVMEAAVRGWGIGGVDSAPRGQGGGSGKTAGGLWEGVGYILHVPKHSPLVGAMTGWSWPSHGSMRTEGSDKRS